MHWPVLIAGIQDANSHFAGVTITWLCADGLDKAPVEPTRKIYGALRGNAVRLRPAGETICVCEGVETGLSIAQACPELPVWCALSAINLPDIAIPQSVRAVIVAADSDPAGEQAARRTAWRFTREGRQVRVARPEHAGEDFNDLRL
jgi:DNA primase